MITKSEVGHDLFLKIVLNCLKCGKPFKELNEASCTPRIGLAMASLNKAPAACTPSGVKCQTVQICEEGGKDAVVVGGGRWWNGIKQGMGPRLAKDEFYCISVALHLASWICSIKYLV